MIRRSPVRGSRLALLLAGLLVVTPSLAQEPVASKAPEAVAPQKLSKKRKEPDDGVRILEEMNTRLAPQAGKIGTSKEKLIMRLGRGERRMFVGRFAR